MYRMVVNMRNILIIISSLILISTLTFAQDILDKVINTYKELKSIRADFIQENYWSEPDIEKISSGTLWIRKEDNKIKLEYSEPKGQLLLSETDKVTIYLPETNHDSIPIISGLKSGQVIIMDSLPIQNLLSPDKLVNEYLKYSEVEFQTKSDSEYIFTFMPSVNSPTDFEFAKLILKIDKSSYLLRGFQYYDEQNNSVKFIFRGIEKNVRIDDDRFFFEIPEDANVIDRRYRKGG